MNRLYLGLDPTGFSIYSLLVLLLTTTPSDMANPHSDPMDHPPPLQLNIAFLMSKGKFSPPFFSSRQVDWDPTHIYVYVYACIKVDDIEQAKRALVSFLEVYRVY